MGDRQQSLEFLSGAFDFERSVIEKALDDAGGNVELAMESLFQYQPSHEVEEDPDIKLASELQAQFDNEVDDISPFSSVPLSQEEEDAKLARELAAQLNFIDIPAQDDATLARQLQNEWNSSQSFGRVPHTSNYTPINLMEGIDIETLLSSHSSEGMESISEQLKTSVIPLIEDEAKKLDIPGSEQKVDAPKLGEITFGFSDIQLESFEIPPEDFNISIEGNTIKISSKKINATISSFDWHFKQEKMLKLSDKGEATASMSNTSIDLTLQIDINYSGPSVNVHDCTVKIGNLDIKVGKNRKSIIYNLVIGLVVRVMKTRLESVLADTIREGINESIMI